MGERYMNFLFYAGSGCEGLGVLVIVYLFVFLGALALSHLFGNICRKIAYSKNRFSNGYYWLGFWTFPVGLIIVCCLPTLEVKKYKNNSVVTKKQSFYLNNLDVKFLTEGYRQMYENNELSLDALNSHISRIMSFYSAEASSTKNIDYGRKTTVSSTNTKEVKKATITQSNSHISLICEDASLSLEEKQRALRNLLNQGKISSPQYSEAMKNIRKNA